MVGRFFRVNQAVKPRGIHWGLNPHVVGRFFRERLRKLSRKLQSLNPHVVGRFFRVLQMAKLLWQLAS